MPGEAIQVGPFTGGLNSYGDPSSIADNELIICENFELDLDGSVKSRPPFVEGASLPLNSTSGMPDILGYFYAAGNVPFLIASDGYGSTYYYDGSWHLITNTFAATAMVEYDNKAWLIAPMSSSNPGGYWTWSGTAGTFTAVADMPKGNTAVVYKERIYIAGDRENTTHASTFYYSNPFGAPTFWPTAQNAIIVSNGDGQAIKKLVVYYNSILVFRSTSIFSYSFSADSANFVLSLIVSDIGLADKKSLVVYKNYLYFNYDDNAFEFVNNRAEQINIKVPFISGSRSNIEEPQARAVSLFNRRIIFSYFDILYVFNLRTRTWTTWKSPTFHAIGQIITHVTSDQYDQGAAFSSYIVPSGSGRVAKMLNISDTFEVGKSETFNCVIQTKNFNYQSAATYKRLFWWGIDASFNGEVVGTATPIIYSQSITWGQLATYTWSSLIANSWDQPISPSVSVTTDRMTFGASIARKFVKFLKGLRFRQLNYQVTFTSDGTPATSPVRLFSLMTYVRSHQHVSKSVS
jgi:hypothetical protein